MTDRGFDYEIVIRPTEWRTLNIARGGVKKVPDPPLRYGLNAPSQIEHQKTSRLSPVAQSRYSILGSVSRDGANSAN
jgi:hypothetical protein